MHACTYLLTCFLQDTVLEYLDLMCTKNSYGVWCLELLNDFESGQLNLPYEDMSVSLYIDAIMDFSYHTFE